MFLFYGLHVEIYIFPAYNAQRNASVKICHLKCKSRKLDVTNSCIIGAVQTEIGGQSSFNNVR